MAAQMASTFTTTTPTTSNSTSISSAPSRKVVVVSCECKIREKTHDFASEGYLGIVWMGKHKCYVFDFTNKIDANRRFGQGCWKLVNINNLKFEPRKAAVSGTDGTTSYVGDNVCRASDSTTSTGNDGKCSNSSTVVTTCTDMNASTVDSTTTTNTPIDIHQVQQYFTELNTMDDNTLRSRHIDPVAFRSVVSAQIKLTEAVKDMLS